MGKTRLIAETGAGQHGVATATAAALFGLACVVYMGAEDMRRQALNVYRMELLGAEVVGVAAGQQTLKDAINEAFRDWVTDLSRTHYVVGSVVGPHPYPTMVRDFQAVIGREARRQMLSARRPPARRGGGLRRRREQRHGHLPCLPGTTAVALVGVEAGGRGAEPGRHARAAGARPARRAPREPAATCCRTPTARSSGPTRVSAGLDYPGVGPEHAFYKDRPGGLRRRQRRRGAGGLRAAVAAPKGIIPALESAHAVAYGVDAGAQARPGHGAS